MRYKDRPTAFWLALLCVAAMAFILATDPRTGLLTYPALPNAVDARTALTPGTLLGLVGGLLILLASVRLIARARR